ncbi:MAG: hypothetical protein KGK00_16395 [Paracoccaceae bacterium]|nr:hypothetical protein [Paracoccaceae bacterium]
MTRSEELFERFLVENELPYERLDEDERRRADFEVTVGGTSIVFEIKQIDGDGAWEEGPKGRIPGKKIRALISDAKGQLKRAAQEGKPAVLVVFNAWDPFQLFGTEPNDFNTAMHGDWLVYLDRSTNKIIGSGRGGGKSLQAAKNTSISALAHLYDCGPARTPSITLFENTFARHPINYADLPACFEVAR